MTSAPTSSRSIQATSLGRRLAALITSETMLYIFKRLLQALLTLLLASALCFSIIQLAPGDFLSQYRQNPQISAETLQQLEIQFGLDKPAWQQYWKWLVQVVTHFNFGMSFTYQRPVVELLWERIPNTLLLSIASIIVTWAIAIPFGIISAVKENQVVDKVLRVISYVAQGFPTLITGLLLLFFAQITAPLFPVGGGEPALITKT